MTSSAIVGGAREADIPRLIRFSLDAVGASMSCHYCRRSASILHGDALAQILQFQEAHFTCDPILAITR